MYEHDELTNLLIKASKRLDGKRTASSHSAANASKRRQNSSAVTPRESSTETTITSTNTPSAASHARDSAVAPAEWPVTGRYRLTCISRRQPVDATDYVLDLRFASNGDTSQLFASFFFPNLDLRGIMRLCPRTSLAPATATRKKSLFLRGFEAACELPDGVGPGRERKDWLMRWRAEEGGAKKVGGETPAQGEFVFKPGQDGSAINITFAMVHEGKHLLFQGVRTSDIQAAVEDHDISLSVRRMRQEWERLYDPEWELDEQPSTSRHVHLESHGPGRHNPWDNPRSGAVIKAKNRPSSEPGSPSVPVQPVIEERPEWAWDVTGRYNVRSPQLAKHLDLQDTGAQMSLMIHLDNNAHHKNMGRQLWGELELGHLCGNFRLCPGFAASEHYMTQFQGFEDACMLQAGVWPGPRPMGESQWGFRWRGFSDLDCRFHDSEFMSEVFFENYRGQVMVSGIIIVDSKPLVLLAVRVADGVNRSRNAPTVSTEWPRYLSLFGE